MDQLKKKVKRVGRRKKTAGVQEGKDKNAEPINKQVQHPKKFGEIAESELGYNATSFQSPTTTSKSDNNQLF